MRGIFNDVNKVTESIRSASNKLIGDGLVAEHGSDSPKRMRRGGLLTALGGAATAVFGMVDCIKGKPNPEAIGVGMGAVQVGIVTWFGGTILDEVYAARSGGGGHQEKIQPDDKPHSLLGAAKPNDSMMS